MSPMRPRVAWSPCVLAVALGISCIPLDIAVTSAASTRAAAPKWTFWHSDDMFDS